MCSLCYKNKIYKLSIVNFVQQTLMMFRKFIYIILLASFLFTSCKKDTFTPVKVTYCVKVADSSTVNITYYSDYYFASGITKTITYLSEGGYWYGVHTAYKQEDYDIKVEYISSVNPEKDYRVEVYFNDTLKVASRIDTMLVQLTELKGTVGN